ncbi:hypothetical protein [Nonomuraea pusilla]|uniref:Guanylate kinase n=1 Tax=Nonomuraea pusilla TaxID=46177 RepID=A0A1H7FXP2_9ACTN|nr:hypothetical protein [Nonomuraea pusilla]SEK30564.1 guanylate kinase [Nonomuraea pusilla]
MRGIVLYGPPASGKTTTTAALTALDRRLVLLRKLKAGSRTGTEYDFVDYERLAELRAAGRLLAETHRYGNVYAVDRLQVEQMAQAGRTPIVHMGNIPDIRRLTQTGAWLPVLLWVTRDVCARRCRLRGNLDIHERLRAWDETMADLRAHDDGLFEVRVSTAEAEPEEVARLITGVFFQHVGYDA